SPCSPASAGSKSRFDRRPDCSRRERASYRRAVGARLRISDRHAKLCSVVPERRMGGFLPSSPLPQQSKGRTKSGAGNSKQWLRDRHASVPKRCHGAAGRRGYTDAMVGAPTTLSETEEPKEPVARIGAHLDLELECARPLAGPARYRLNAIDKVRLGRG